MKRNIIFIFFIIILTFECSKGYAFAASKYNMSVPVIMYHKISNNSSEWSEYCVSEEEFENDIKEFLKAGFKPISFSELLQLKNKYNELCNQSQYVNELFLPEEEYKQSIVITLDDGYSDNYYIAFEIAKRYNIKINISVVGLYSNSSELYLSREQIKEMDESGLVEFGNHTYALHDYPKEELKKLISSKENYLIMKNDISANNKFLTDIIGKKIKFFTYPYGVCSSVSEKILNEFGYDISLLTDSSDKFFRLSDSVRKIPRINRVCGAVSEDVVSDIAAKLKKQNYAYYMSNYQSYEKYLKKSKTENIKITFAGSSVMLPARVENNVSLINIYDLLNPKIILCENNKNYFVLNFEDNAIYIDKNSGICSCGNTQSKAPVMSGNDILIRNFFEHLGYKVEYDGLNKIIKII